jgi:hypothetical protein
MLKRTPWIAFAAIALVSLSVKPAFAQSSDRDFPTPVVSREINGSLDSQSDYFYSFTANPGELSIQFDLMPSGGSIAVATLQLYDESGNELLNTPLIPTANSRGGDRQSVSVTIPTRQKILMRITEGTGYGGIYSIRLGGAIVLANGSGNGSGNASGNGGTVVTMPTQGVLRVEFSDGSAQEFDLSRVRRVLTSP